MAGHFGQLQFKLWVYITMLVLGFLGVTLWILVAILTHPLSWFRKSPRSGYPDCLLDDTLGTHQYMTANGIKFHYVVKGERTKPLMLMIHGFPEFWYSWRHQILEFSKYYRVVAIDLRGYGETYRPPKQSDYEFETLREDIVELITMLGYAKCTLVAHDWGGLIAWNVAQKNSEVVDNLIVMNCPHPRVLNESVSKGWKQIFKSWYMFMFKIPKLPELAISLNDYNSITTMFTGQSTGAVCKDNFTPEVLEIYKYTFSQPGALTAALNYYRCLLKWNSFIIDRNDVISVPVLLIWGDLDKAFGIDLVDRHIPIAENLTIKHIPNCSHWVQQDQPETVNKYMREFLEEQGSLEN